MQENSSFFYVFFFGLIIFVQKKWNLIPKNNFRTFKNIALSKINFNKFMEIFYVRKFKKKITSFWAGTNTRIELDKFQN